MSFSLGCSKLGGCWVVIEPRGHQIEYGPQRRKQAYKHHVLCNTYVHELVHSVLLDHHWPIRHKSVLQNAMPPHKFLMFYNGLWNVFKTQISCHMYDGQSITIVVLRKKLLLPDIWVNLIFQGVNLILHLVKDTPTFKIKRFQYTDNTITNQPPKWTHFHSLWK